MSHHGPRVRPFTDLDDVDVLSEEQRRLARLRPPRWRPPAGPVVAAGAFVAFARGEQGPGRVGDRAHVGVAATRDVEELVSLVVGGVAGATYAPGLLAAREGAMLEDAFRALVATGVRPVVLVVDATGRDHPRRAGLALHLGAALDLPSVGVTHRPLLATGPQPADRQGASTELTLGDTVVGRWVRTRRGARPVAVHAAWRTDAGVATEVVLRVTARARTPEPLRLARTRARTARAEHEGRRG